MAYKFNPFTGNLDQVGAGGGGAATCLAVLLLVVLTPKFNLTMVGLRLAVTPVFPITKRLTSLLLAATLI